MPVPFADQPADVRRPGPEHRAPVRPLIVLLDEDQHVRVIVERLAGQLGFDVVWCADSATARETASRRHARLLLADASLIGAELDEVVRRLSSCELVIMCAHATADSVLQSITRGASECLDKPLDPDRLRRILNRLRDELSTRAHVFALEARVAEQTEFHGMVGRTPAMREVFDTIRRLAPYASRVLITGETGTGKELVARAFHQAGAQPDQPFLVLDAATSLETVSRLAQQLAAARGGTLFLDGVSELSPDAQSILLRLITTPPLSEITVVGALSGRAESAVGVNRELLDVLRKVEVTLPPLRDRREDIPYLVALIVKRAAKQLRKPLEGLTPEAERLIRSAAWPGNVRELRQVVERGCLLAEERLITLRDLASPGLAGRSLVPSLDDAGPLHLRRLERDHIVDTLRQLNGNRMAAAKALGISRRALYRRIDRHHITIPAARARGRAAALPKG